MKRHKHPWDKVAGLDNLIEAAQDALRGKRGKRARAAFFQIWEKEVVRRARELDEGSYRSGEYHYFTIHEPKVRVVAAWGMNPNGIRERRNTRKAGACAGRCWGIESVAGCTGDKRLASRG